MSQEMKLKIEFPTMDTLSPEYRTLVSIYIEDATLRCVGNYYMTNTSEWSHLSCGILSKASMSTNTILRASDSGICTDFWRAGWSTQETVKMVLPYTDTNNPIFSTTYHGGAHVSPASLQYEIPNVATVLCTANTSFRVLSCQYYREIDLPISQNSHALNIGINSIPCVITPYIADDVNTDVTLVPSAVVSTMDTYTDIYGSNSQKITKPVDVAAITADISRNYAYSLKTDSFVINNSDSVANTSTNKEVYYKVGFMHYHYSDSIEEYQTGGSVDEYINAELRTVLKSDSAVKDLILNELKDPNFSFAIHRLTLSNNVRTYFGFPSIHVENLDADFRVGCIHDLYYSFSDSEGIGVPVFTTNYNDNHQCGVPRSIIVPIGVSTPHIGSVYSDTIVVGFLYMKLYNVDNTPVVDDISYVSDIGMKNGASITSIEMGNLHLGFKDI